MLLSGSIMMHLKKCQCLGGHKSTCAALEKLSPRCAAFVIDLFKILDLLSMGQGMFRPFCKGSATEDLMMQHYL